MSAKRRHLPAALTGPRFLLKPCDKGAPVLRPCEYERQFPPPRLWVRPSGAGRESDDGCRDAIPFCASKAISLRRCSLYAAFLLTIVPTAVAMSASDFLSTHPPATSSV